MAWLFVLIDTKLSFIENFIDWAHHGLLESEEAQVYLLGRGVSKKQWVRHRLGYVIGDFLVDSNLDPGHDFSVCSEKEKKSQWCDSCRYTRWSTKWDKQPDGSIVYQAGRRIVGSVVFPLTSYSGKVYGFQVRSLVEKSYDTFILKDRPEGYFFGTAAAIDSIWSTRKVSLVEGPFDHLIYDRLIAPNVLSIVTSSLGKAQVRFLKRFVDDVDWVGDLDKAGRQGFESFFKFNGRNFGVRKIEYPSIRKGDKDIGDFWKSVGDTSFSNYFKEKI